MGRARCLPLLLTVLLVGIPAIEALRAEAEDDALPVAGRSLTEKDYESLLQSRKVGFPDERGITFGPVALRADSRQDSRDYLRMLEKMGETPDEDDKREIMIEVKVARLPNLNLGDDPLQIRITKLHTDDATHDNPTDEDGEPIRARTPVLREAGPEPHLHGTAKITLPPGLSNEDIQAIEGTAVLRLPLNLERLDFDLHGIHQPRSIQELTLTPLEVRKSTVKLAYQGPIERFLSVVGYDNERQLVARTSWYVSGRPLSAADRQRHEDLQDPRARAFTAEMRKQEIVTSFAAEVARVQVLVASGFAEREFSFRLAR